MEFKTAERKDIRLKIAVSGLAGAGKTYSSLTLAKGLLNGDMSKVGFIQTEVGRAEMYLDKFGEFKVLNLHPPFTPNKFIEAIDAAEKAGLKCIIIDSISDEWAGIGGCLEMHEQASKLSKNSYTAWGKITPKHEAFFNKILTSPLHIISTMKQKADVVIEKDSRGKSVPKKLGVKDIQREGSDYRFHLCFEIDRDHKALATKDNTSLFAGKPAFMIDEGVGAGLRDWCLS